ncbi:hypothetical protein COV86_03350 [Candidatus Roizmanbacteria bacterium CG11_big_fil_rev_8_21_14_0_20_35_14]|uniref:Kazal-like domain-containing protein n=1 Tax=Candidatus Roizmanbacteria bacterium CG11_big_fil_rev_8_21_14_0_20_35_14 TaxID=1974855 RepID=A0A2H0KM95_9BACT|nr:MAG: hypothetical protein COV86_03350 [Candidatus Roizmanbacteria bacterium CG11_big_fil_rev_8_21_14_0_20_35_14]
MEPPTPQIKKPLVLIMSFLLIITVAIAGLFYFQIQKLSSELSQLQVPVQPTPTPIAKNEVLGIQTNTCCSCPTKVSPSIIGTNGWVIYEEGKDYSSFLPETCRNVVCQPCPPPEEQNQTKIDCKDPRPEVCTMECIENPPYICGSDGKSYCTVCQACSNKNVTWYEMKASACTKE